MPQRPAKRHVLADIRIECGLTQPELAKILGCAAVTVQRIEQGKLGLSEELAQKIEGEFDVSAGFLLANDPKESPVTKRGGRWAKELYEFAQGVRSVVVEKTPSGKLRYHLRTGPHSLDEAKDEFVEWKLADYSSKIHAMLNATKGSPKQGILVHRLNTAIKALLEDFKPDQVTLANHGPRIQKLRAAYDCIAKRVSDEEHDRIWREEQES
jgi:transcriptional regulator with XRE-family HTH domain